MKKQQRHNRPINQLRFSSFTALVLAVTVMGVIVLAPSLHTFLDQQRELQELRAKTEDAKQQVEDLTKERSRWADPSYIRTQAKERLYYVLPGERSFLIINDVDEELDYEAPAVSTELTETEIDWVEQLTASFLIAGLSEEEPAQLNTPQIGPKR